jgi:hypothetical protein
MPTRDLARYLRSVVYGIAVQAAGGAGREDLHKIADIALLAWPTRKPGKARAKRSPTSSHREMPKPARKDRPC